MQTVIIPIEPHVFLQNIIPSYLVDMLSVMIEDCPSTPLAVVSELKLAAAYACEPRTGSRLDRLLHNSKFVFCVDNMR